MTRKSLCAEWVGLFLFYAMMIFPMIAGAMPIADYKEKMSDEEQWGYLSGGISALTFQYAHDGNQAKSKCVYDWFYKSGHGGKDMVVELLKARLADPSLHVEAIMLAVINKKCGHLD